MGLDTPQVVPKDLGKKRKIHIKTCVANCYEIIKSWNNPFEQSKSLSSLSSGIEAPLDVQNDIMNAANIGDTQAKTFISSRIESGVTGFHDPIKKNKLKTFCSLSKKRQIKVKDTFVAVKSDREIFARLLVIQRKRGIDIKDVLKFELSSLPLSLATVNGTLCKTVKSKLFQSFMPLISTISSDHNNIPVIADGMVLLQKLPPYLATFGELSDYLLSKITKGSNRISYFVTDQYLEESIKSLEREKRSHIGTV